MCCALVIDFFIWSFFCELKNGIGGGFWRFFFSSGLCKFLKFNLCCYNILKIINISIIIIKLSLFLKKTFFQKKCKFLYLSLYFPNLKVLSSPPSRLPNKIILKKFLALLAPNGRLAFWLAHLYLGVGIDQAVRQGPMVWPTESLTRPNSFIK